jgi:hypothetical protein
MSAQTDGVTQKKFLMTPLGRRSVRLHVHSSPHLKSKADENRAPVKSSFQQVRRSLSGQGSATPLKDDRRSLLSRCCCRRMYMTMPAVHSRLRILPMTRGNIGPPIIHPKTKQASSNTIKPRAHQIRRITLRRSRAVSSNDTQTIVLRSVRSEHPAKSHFRYSTRRLQASASYRKPRFAGVLRVQHAR